MCRLRILQIKSAAVAGNGCCMRHCNHCLPCMYIQMPSATPSHETAPASDATIKTGEQTSAAPSITWPGTARTSPCITQRKDTMCYIASTLLKYLIYGLGVSLAAILADFIIWPVLNDGHLDPRLANTAQLLLRILRLTILASILWWILDHVHRPWPGTR